MYDMHYWVWHIMNNCCVLCVIVLRHTYTHTYTYTPTHPHTHTHTHNSHCDSCPTAISRFGRVVHAIEVSTPHAQLRAGDIIELLNEDTDMFRVVCVSEE